MIDFITNLLNKLFLATFKPKRRYFERQSDLVGNLAVCLYTEVRSQNRPIRNLFCDLTCRTKSSFVFNLYSFFLFILFLSYMNAKYTC